MAWTKFGGWVNGLDNLRGCQSETTSKDEYVKKNFPHNYEKYLKNKRNVSND